MPHYVKRKEGRMDERHTCSCCCHRKILENAIPSKAAHADDLIRPLKLLTSKFKKLVQKLKEERTLRLSAEERLQQYDIRSQEEQLRRKRECSGVKEELAKERKLRENAERQIQHLEISLERTSMDVVLEKQANKRAAEQIQQLQRALMEAQWQKQSAESTEGIALQKARDLAKRLQDGQDSAEAWRKKYMDCVEEKNKVNDTLLESEKYVVALTSSEQSLQSIIKELQQEKAANGVNNQLVDEIYTQLEGLMQQNVILREKNEVYRNKMIRVRSWQSIVTTLFNQSGQTAKNRGAQLQDERTLRTRMALRQVILLLLILLYCHCFCCFYNYSYCYYYHDYCYDYHDYCYDYYCCFCYYYALPDAYLSIYIDLSLCLHVYASLFLGGGGGLFQMSHLFRWISIYRCE